MNPERFESVHTLSQDQPLGDYDINANVGFRSQIASCALCTRTENLLTCSRCMTTQYCCKKHQREDWTNHKTVCKKSEEPKPVPDPEPLKQELALFNFPRPFKEELILANKGRAESQFLVSLCYFGGTLGAPLDMKKAVHFLKLAVAQNHARAQWRLGFHHQFGYGVEKDPKRAFQLVFVTTQV